MEKYIDMCRNKSAVSIIFSVVLLLSFVFASVSSAKSTSDPNHKGWRNYKSTSATVNWQPVKAKCQKCRKLVEQYNNTMQELMVMRSNYHKIPQSHVLLKGSRSQKNKLTENSDISVDEGQAISQLMDGEVAHQNYYDFHGQQVVTLEKQARYLQWAIAECEQTACSSKERSKIKKIKLADDLENNFQPDLHSLFGKYKIDWKGPYTTDCVPCKKYTATLNALPGWLVRANFDLQNKQAKLKELNLFKAYNTFYREYGWAAEEIKSTIDSANSRLAIAQRKLKALVKLFRDTKAQLEPCEQHYCPKISSLPPIQQCPTPQSASSISVGSNSEVGSSANFKEKAKSKLVGAASKAIGGLLGIGGGGAKEEGPTIYKDPIKKKQKIKIKQKKPKLHINIGAIFTPDGLLVSTDLLKIPNDGTFHRIFLENQGGWQLNPIALYLYEIWKEWKLTVSWTRDTYVDNELVKHEEGGWNESGRELIARGEEMIYQEQYNQPLWQHLGFNTAVSGAKSLGTLFPVSPQMLKNEPMSLIVHVTQPKSDPVSTVPFMFMLSLNEVGKIIVEHVDNTLALLNPCPEKAIVGGDGNPITDENKEDSVVEDDLDFGDIELTDEEIKKLLVEPKDAKPQKIKDKLEGVEDRDNDGIPDRIDVQPDVPSTIFFNPESNVIGRIVDANGNTVRIIDYEGGGIGVEVSGGGENDSTVEILGIELEVEPGTIFEASFN
ncbi:MAG: hypothetical protein JKX81_04780 [Arenicella sp.]|nr:hypothetical protein [Arenicella sp.]